jgi:hypothetical protein
MTLMQRAKRTTILKSDVLGRVTTTRAQREALLDEFERSGMKGRPFARLVGVKYPTFASWIQTRRRVRGGSAARPPHEQSAVVSALPMRSLGWVEAVVAPSAAEALSAPCGSAKAALEVLLPGGAKLLVADAAQAALAAQILNHLRAAC